MIGRNLVIFIKSTHSSLCLLFCGVSTNKFNRMLDVYFRNVFKILLGLSGHLIAFFHIWLQMFSDQHYSMAWGKEVENSMK